MMTIEEIIARIPNAKLFSVLDASSGYWQIQLDNESAKVVICLIDYPLAYLQLKMSFSV